MEQISTASSLGLQFNLQTRLFNNVLEGISEDESNQRASETVNHIKWVAGHVLTTRLSFHQLVGFEEDQSLTELFGHGHGLDESKTYPSIEFILEKWNKISTDFGDKIGQLPAAVLDSEAPSKTPINDMTMRGMLSFISFHEAYHIGQLGILRKYLGKEAMHYD